MLFTSLRFILFFLIVYLLNISVSRRYRIGLLILSSLLFYGTGSPIYLWNFLSVLFLGGFFVRLLTRNNSPSVYWSGILILVGNLIFYKYSDFLTHAFSLHSGFRTHGEEDTILPLAISFYTFQIIALLTDIRRKEIKEVIPHHHYLLFISFFPQLVAGPIMRHGDFFHQLTDGAGPVPDRRDVYEGIFLILLGMVKKVLIADNLAFLISPVYDNPSQYDRISSIIAPMGYAFRLYADFSGYTDMARGFALLLGFRLPENFRAPFFAENMGEFWRRWHITLSAWLRDYIYIPLGGSRVSESLVLRNLIITFFLGGIWHGAGWAFMGWGLFHGLLLVLERLLFRWPGTPAVSGITKIAIRIMGALYTFLAFSFSMILFDARDAGRAIFMAENIFSPSVNPENITNPHNATVLLLLLFLLPLFQYLQTENAEWWLRKIRSPAGLILTGIVVMILLGRFAPSGREFIYYRF